MLNVNTGTATAIDRNRVKTPRMSKTYRIGQVLTFLTYHKYGVTSYDIAKEIGVSDRQARYILADMARRGLIQGENVEHRPGWIKCLIYPAVKDAN